MEAHRRPGQVRIGPFQPGPVHDRPGTVLGRRPAGHEAPVEPVQESDRATMITEQVGLQFGEPLGLAGEPVRLGRGRRGEPGQFRVRGEVAGADHRGDGGLIERLAEQLLDQGGLVGGERPRRRPGQSDHGGVRKSIKDLGQQPAPDLEQMVALVQDQRDRAGVTQRGDQRPAVVVQSVQQARSTGAPSLLVHLGVGIEDRQRLVGQRGHRGAERAVGRSRNRRRREAGPLGQPLALDRRVGAEGDDRPAQPPGGLQPDHGLARPGRQHHP